MTKKTLRVSDLSSRHLGLTDAIASGYAEAVSVCLDRHHTPPADFNLRDKDKDDIATTDWTNADERTRRAWANVDDATEAAAYGLALAAIEATRGLVAVRRAETKTGADYYLGQPGNAVEDLEASFRLEVSGTDAGTAAAIEGRLRQKLEQARQGSSNLPAIASVVGFAALRIVSADLETA